MEKFTLCKVSLATVKKPVYYIATENTFKEGQYIEVPYGMDDFLVYATVMKDFF